MGDYLTMRFYGEPTMNRTLCDVLRDMRTAYETRNFSYLLGLIEEAQMMGNRMEAKLYTIKDFGWLEKEIKQLKAEKKKLKDELPDSAGGY